MSGRIIPICFTELKKEFLRKLSVNEIGFFVIHVGIQIFD